jgi:endonuclease-3
MGTGESAAARLPVVFYRYNFLAPWEITMPRGSMPRQPSRSGRQDRVKKARPILKTVAKAAAPMVGAIARLTEPKKPLSKAKATAATKAIAKTKRSGLKNYNPLAPERVSEILQRLDARYPHVVCALHHTNAWELLVATILSAQCTDVRVNLVTPGLFQKYPTMQAFAALEPEDLEDDIRSTGFFRNKSKSVVGAARKIIADFGGEVPRTMDELLQVPGVARKTANVVLGSWFKIAAGVVVDTHVQRISRRLELTRNEDPRKIEQDLMLVVPREHWILFSHQIIHHGRALCVARSPKCADCPLENICHAADKTWSTVDIHKTAKP